MASQPKAERKADAETRDRPGREPTSEERAHAAAARAVGQQLGPRKLGGTIIEADGRVTYTRDGAVSATAGGPPDPTIQPGQFEEEAERGVKVVDRDDAAPLTGDEKP
jgi:hypothetical protein